MLKNLIDRSADGYCEPEPQDAEPNIDCPVFGVGVHGACIASRLRVLLTLGRVFELGVPWGRAVLA